MIGVVVVADSGAALRRLSVILLELPHVYIVRHCSGHADVVAAIVASDPDIVLVDEMRWPRRTVHRIAEITRGTRAHVVVCASRLEDDWLADALRAGASAVVPQSGGAAALRHVLAEVALSDLPLGRPRHDAAEAA